MNLRMIGDSDNPLVQVTLAKGEQIKLESGAMVYMQDVVLEGTTNSDKKGLGGFLKAAARSAVSGENVFITVATGQNDGAVIGIAPSTVGCIKKLEVGPVQYRLNTGVFLACDNTVSYNVVSQKSVTKAIFGGTGGFFIMETTGSGDLLVNAFGDLVELNLQGGKPLAIDNEHVVAWDSNLDYNIRVASGTFGFTSGEGLVNEFSGTGKVLIQTRNVHNLANILIPYLPKST
jgi:uncharacterized protein (TIGR00266 family)